MRPTYTAKTARDGRWWFIQVPELDGVFSQARRLDQVEHMTRDVVSLMLEVPPDSFDVVVDVDLSSLDGLQPMIEDARAQRDKAAALKQDAIRMTDDAIARLRAAGFTSRDTGALLGVSAQRVSQFERKTSGVEHRPMRPREHAAG